MIWAARMGNLKIGIDPTSQSEPKTWFSNEGQATEQGCVWMMPRGQAMALLEDYLSNVYPLLPVIHGPTSRRLINEFYDRLSQAEQVKPQAAALILGIGAASAYFWQPRTGHHGHFTSAKEATQLSLVWQDWSSDILTNTTLRENSSTLEGVQAWTLLSFMVQNVEGCSYRFKSLHSCSLVAAQALSLHLVDSPRSDQNEDSVSRELKRRLWWHIATTDW